MSCFVCLEKCSNRVCYTCSCSSHIKCWGKYLQSQRYIQNYIDCDEYCLNIFLLDSACPVCKQNTVTSKALTRSEVANIKSNYMLAYFYNTLNLLSELYLADFKPEKYKDFFKVIIREKNCILKDNDMSEIIEAELTYLYKVQNWKTANMYHYELFGQQIHTK